MSRRSRHDRHDPATKIALPIVPMLDMSFQLLFFFIITFNPGKVEGQMTMNLPAIGKPQAKAPQDVIPDSADKELDVPSDFVVVVKHYDTNLTLAVRDAEKVYEVGKLTDLDRNAASEERRKRLDALLADLTKMLTEKLEEKRKNLKEGETLKTNVKIEANSAMKYSILVGVMDACIQSGYTQVGFAPPPDLPQ